MMPLVEQSTSRLDALRQHGARPLRFLVAGAINTVFGLSIFPLLLWSSQFLHEHYMLALGISQITSLVFAFATHKFGVFRTRANILREFAAFASFYVMNFAANWATLPFLVEIVGIKPIVAQFGFAVIVIVGSYFWHSRITFRPPNKSIQPRSQETRCEP